MSNYKLNIKNKVVLGNGTTSVSVLNDENKNLCILFGEIPQAKIGSKIHEDLDEDVSYSEIKIKNSKSAKVLLKASKAVYKELKKQEKELGLTK